MAAETALLTLLLEKIKSDTLVLPTLPATALKVRKTADDPDVNLSTIAIIISQDPALSARMIKISNSAYLGRAVKVVSIQQAITRIGLSQIKNIATALAMEQLFISKNEIVKQYMTRIWADTTDIVANSLAVMQMYVKQTKNRTLNYESMMLAALVHNIGVLPIMTEAERHEHVFANPTFLDLFIDKLASKLGTNILIRWGFESQFVYVAQNWKDFSVTSDTVSYLDLARLGAAVCGKFDSHKDEIFNSALEKGIVDDLSMLFSDEFNELRDAAKQMFQ